MVSTRTRGRVGVATIAAGRLDAVDPGHPDVHQDDVGAQPAAQLDRLAAVGRLADDRDVVLALRIMPEAGPDERLVVGEQDADHASPNRYGSRARTA